MATDSGPPHRTVSRDPIDRHINTTGRRCATVTVVIGCCPLPATIVSSDTVGSDALLARCPGQPTGISPTHRPAGNIQRRQCSPVASHPKTVVETASAERRCGQAMQWGLGGMRHHPLLPCPSSPRPAFSLGVWLAFWWACCCGDGQAGVQFCGELQSLTGMSASYTLDAVRL